MNNIRQTCQVIQSLFPHLYPNDDKLNTLPVVHLVQPRESTGHHQGNDNVNGNAPFLLHQRHCKPCEQ